MLITYKKPRNDTLKNTENSIYEAKNATFYHFNITFFSFSQKIIVLLHAKMKMK